MDERRRDLVDWPPLHEGANEPGPTDSAGEYLAGRQSLPVEPPARIPGQMRAWEQPIDVATPSAIPVEPPDGFLSEAERSVRDSRHIVRGKPSMSSS
jgi:hypothetical protein